jgi:transcriptional regulator with XRE-family HTH domain
MILNGVYILSTIEQEVPKFLNKKFLEWQMEIGYRRTQTEFAEYLGVEPGTLGHWMNGRRKPDLESVELLAEKLGPEIYDLAGYLRPDPQLRRVVSIWHKIDERGKSIIMNITSEAVNKEETQPAQDSGSSIEVPD